MYEASDVVVSCLRVGENSQQIRSLQYSLNGGAMTSGEQHYREVMIEASLSTLHACVKVWGN